MARKATLSSELTWKTSSPKRTVQVRKSPAKVPSSKPFGITSPVNRESNGLDGGLLEITADGILGWAWKPLDPSTPVAADLVCDGDVLGSVVADMFDSPNIRNRIGPGIPGFLARLSMLPTGPYPISLQLRSKQGDALGNPLVVRHPREFGSLAQAMDASQFEGYVDYIADGYVTGWAWAPAIPDQQVTVELIEDGHCLDRTSASLHREDLASGGKRNGFCGFRLELPISLLDERVHNLKVVVANTQVELPNGSLSFGPLAASSLLKELSSLRAEVARLVTLVERVVSPRGELQIKLIQTIAERMGALLEVQRETIQGELDSLRALALRPARYGFDIQGTPGGTDGEIS